MNISITKHIASILKLPIDSALQTGFLLSWWYIYGDQVIIYVKKNKYIFAFSGLHVCRYIFIHFVCPFIRFARQHSITLLYCCSVCITCYSPDKDIKLQKVLLQASYSLDSAIASSSFHNNYDMPRKSQFGAEWTKNSWWCKQVHVCPYWSLFNELFLFVQCTAYIKTITFFIKEKLTTFQNTKISLPNRNV